MRHCPIHITDKPTKAVWAAEPCHAWGLAIQFPLKLFTSRLSLFAEDLGSSALLGFLFCQGKF
jgi:hypothetical protein